jgi:hypothetical protein
VTTVHAFATMLREVAPHLSSDDTLHTPAAPAVRRAA